jgi:glycosyltransferase involved in cell wall biosynthesis
MGFGTPVASIDCLGGPAEVIKHNQSGILTSAEEFSMKIIEYFKNPEKQLFLRKNALKTVLKSYTIDITYDVLKKSVNV